MFKTYSTLIALQPQKKKKAFAPGKRVDQSQETALFVVCVSEFTYSADVEKNYNGKHEVRYLT